MVERSHYNVVVDPYVLQSIRSKKFSDDKVSLHTKPENVVEKASTVDLSNLTCGMCKSIAIDPVEDKDGNCAHHFCRECI